MKYDLSQMTNEDFYHVLMEMQRRNIIRYAMANAINDMIVQHHLINEVQKAI